MKYRASLKNYNINHYLNNYAENHKLFFESIYEICKKYSNKIVKNEIPYEDRQDVIYEAIADLYAYKLKKYDSKRGRKSTYIKMCLWQLLTIKLTKLNLHYARQHELKQLAAQYRDFFLKKQKKS